MPEICGFSNWTFSDDIHFGNPVYAGRAFTSVLMEFNTLLHLPIDYVGKIEILYSDKWPMTVPRNFLVNGHTIPGYQIKLNPSDPGDLRKIIYQFSHEVNHVILKAKYDLLGSQFLWIYEMLCQLAVLIITSVITDVIKDEDLNLSVGDLQEYHERICNSIPNVDISCFIANIESNKSQLKSVPLLDTATMMYDTWIETYIDPLSKCIFRSIQKDLSQWQMIKALIDFDYNAPQSYRDFFTKWRDEAIKKSLPCCFLEQLFSVQVPPDR